MTLTFKALVRAEQDEAGVFYSCLPLSKPFEAKNNDQDEDAGCFKAFTVAVATDSFTEKLSKPLRSEEQ